nr:MAG TPA: hypothetical protein [Caudoviricetes sp.]
MGDCCWNSWTRRRKLERHETGQGVSLARA